MNNETLWEHLGEIEDKDSRYSIDVVAKRKDFTPVEADFIHPRSYSAYWYRLVLDNNTAVDLMPVLKIELAYADELTLYLLDEGSDSFDTVPSGATVSMFERPLVDSYMVFPLDVPSGESKTVFLRLRMDGDTRLPISISNQTAFINNRISDIHFDDLFYGISFGFFLFNIFLFISTKKRMFGYFAGYVIVMNLTLSSSNDGMVHYFYQYLGITPSFNKILFTVTLTNVFMLLFFQQFLSVRSYSYQIFRSSQYYLAITLVGTLFSLTDYFSISMAIIFGSSLLLYPYQLMAAFRLWRLGSPNAAIFIGSIGSLVLIGFLAVLQTPTIGVLPNNQDLVSYSLQIAITIQMLILCVGLGIDLKKSKQIELDTMQQQQNKHIQQIQAEQKVEAENAARVEKSNLIASMSHEIRTPMNGIVGISNLLQETELTEAQSTYLDSITSTGNSMLNVINNILDYSKIEAGKMSLEKIPFELPKLISDSFTDYGLEFTNNINMKLVLSDDLPTYVVGDPLRLQQILNNLLSNAAKFTDEGSITLTADVSHNIGLPEDKYSLTITVTDTGKGMSPELQGSLFESILPGDNRTEMVTGTGLGLAIVKRLSRLMDGDIRVTSVLGEGSSFILTVIMGHPTKAQVDKLVETTKPVKGQLRGKKILVADDNPVNQTIVLGLLNKLGVTADFTNDGEVALDRFKTHPNRYCAVLMDCEMPVMDGYEATQAIREYEQAENLGSTPIISLSAHNTSEHFDKLKQYGFTDHIDKPITMSKLTGVLQEAIQ